MKKKNALITGVTGQDGSYLAELLLEKGYVVYGLRRRSSSFNTGRIDHLIENPDFHLIYGDLTDTLSIQKSIAQSRPDEIYNLAAQSHVAVSFENPEYTANVDGLGTLRIIESLRQFGWEKSVRIYQASTSELFGTNTNIPQNEDTLFMPASPYGVAKLYAYWISKIYRDSYGMFISNGILFNHESPRRGETFVSRKIVRGALKFISKGDYFSLGNLYSKRDWGHARDYVDMQWRIMQASAPDDFVIATGIQYTVKQFCEQVFFELGKSIDWSGEGVNEVGMVDGKLAIKIDPKYFRPNEVPTLLGDATKAFKCLGWKPKITFQELVAEMVAHEKHM